MDDTDIKPPRAPRRHQSEVDAARHERNQLEREMELVNKERKRLRGALRKISKDTKADADHLRAFAKEVLRVPTQRSK